MFTPKFKEVLFTKNIIVAANNLVGSGMEANPVHTDEDREMAERTLGINLAFLQSSLTSNRLLIICQQMIIAGYLQALQDNKLIDIPEDEPHITMEEAQHNELMGVFKSS